jgi:putative ABC transport system substrate-binding protein
MGAACRRPRCAWRAWCILKGAQPGDLSIEVVTQHKLSINAEVDREIGVTISPEILAKADNLIK